MDRFSSGHGSGIKVVKNFYDLHLSVIESQSLNYYDMFDDIDMVDLVAYFTITGD